MRPLSCSMWDLVPDQRSKLGPLHWEHGVLATGPPGKSLVCVLEEESSGLEDGKLQPMGQIQLLAYFL